MEKKRILVCGGNGCTSLGCQEIKNSVLTEISRWGLEEQVDVIVTGCMGACSLGPMLVVQPGNCFYGHLTPDKVREIVEQHLYRGEVVEGLLLDGHKEIMQIPFFGKQIKIALRNVGQIDPEDINQYIAFGGYQALEKVLREQNPESVIEKVLDSGLRGRSGSGFPTGVKWRMMAENTTALKYVICNADEGEPGAFMDLSIIEGDPHSIIEGMVIGAYAMKANKGIIYIRVEYSKAVNRLTLALEQARLKGFLGKNICESGFEFDIEIRVGAGAFVCGEETALMNSVEGKRGEPNPKPPYPADKGLWGHPTLINNVETWANIVPIVDRGGAWFRTMGTESSPGTKVFSLAGKVEKRGLVEVPLGISLGEVIFDIAGGIPRGKRFKAAQTGGLSGGCIPVEYLNTPLDFEQLNKLGTIMGSGGLIVMDQDSCMVDMAKYFMEFVQEESCGKCVPCRLGTKQMLAILKRITSGQGQLCDIDKLLKLGEQIKDTALCGLGQTASNSVLSTIRYFRHEYEEHIKNKYCRASVCTDLFVSPCQNSCPAGVDIPRYIEAIQKKDYNDALDIIREDNPFPSVCGRVCSHPCESRCQRAEIDQPINIRMLKRFVAEEELSNWEKSVKQVQRAMTQVRKNGKKIAVVGSGPAGLTAAFFLAKWGYQVMVIEAQATLGGMLALTIPAYRLPREILFKEIEWILAHGIDVMLNTRVGKDISLNDLLQDYDAVFLGVGSQRDVPLCLPGEELPEVYSTLKFLKHISLDEPVQVGKKVVVIGGGNSAIDAARSARRMGAEDVCIVYRRDVPDMPADEYETIDALQEGIRIISMAAPVKILGKDGHVSGLECIRMEKGPFDNSGRRAPVPLEGVTFILEADTVITALGQFQDIEELVYDTEISLDNGNAIQIDKESMMTSIKGVFAGGNCVKGHERVIEAIADGRKAAQAIDKYLEGTAHILKDKKLIKRTRFTPVIEEVSKRQEPPMLSPALRKDNFNEVERTCTQEQAFKEACRCLRCDVR